MAMPSDPCRCYKKQSKSAVKVSKNQEVGASMCVWLNESTSNTLSSSVSTGIQPPSGGGRQFESKPASLDEPQFGQEKKDMVGLVFKTT